MLSSLPSQPTPFIGRETELAGLLAMLAQPDCRLITILGPGGVGKTRLALAAAENYTRQSSLPVFTLSLDAPRIWEQTSAAIANAIGCTLYGDEDVNTQLIACMKDRQFLLVLDNIEHVADGAGYMTKLIGAAPGVQFLLTSRERLSLRVETVFALEGFEVSTWQSLEEASSAGAVRLFLSTARRARADFELGEGNLAHINRVCRIAEGLPLAIELAAAWVDTLSVKEIADEIEMSYTFLSSDLQDLPERHRNMVATFEVSWKRLPADVQDSLLRMSVFRGGFTRSAALAVAGASPHTLQVLVNRSLLKYTDDQRYTIHELLRQYLGDKLDEIGQPDTIKAAHSRHFLDWLRTSEPLIKGRDQRNILERIECDFANVRFAWENALERQDYAALNGALESLFWFCMMRTHYYDGEQIFEHVQTLVSNSDEVRLLQARARLRGFWIERWRRGSFSDPAEAVPQIDAMRHLFQDTQQRRDAAVCLLVLGDASRYVGDDFDYAHKCLSNSLEQFRALGDDFYAAWALHFLGRLALMTEGLGRAVQFQQESLDLRERCGDLNGVLYARFNLGDYFLQMGDFDRSTTLLKSMLESSRETGERSCELMATAVLGLIEFLRADLTGAAELSRQAFAAASSLNHPLGRTYAVLVESLNAVMGGEPGRADERLHELELLKLHGIVRYWLNLARALAQVDAEERTRVRHYVHEALSYAIAVQGAGVMAWCLPVCAVIAAQEGDLSRSAALIALADKTGLADWSDVWGVFTDLRAALEDRLGASGLTAEDGQQLDLTATITALLRTYGDDPGGSSRFAPQVMAANQALQEPLSDRELEVLAWIARGLQNAEIAERLVVEMSTVKKHVSHIYGKLGVITRAQAILKAQQLGLV